MMKVYWVTELCEYKKNRGSRERCLAFYLLDRITDYLRPKKILLPFYEFSLTIIPT
jgi:hypothetical protein